MPVKDMEIVKQIADESYFKGYWEALEDYAWWKDGIQYVGSCGRTYKEAFRELCEMFPNVEWKKFIGRNQGKMRAY